ncbi:MAG: fumarylacetoacetate hydrolase family protein [Bdellovibrionaceae bacterium]|nr:fumarylacetoacetate hydrolase family protein [Pseudobdellovibrionaceae bacterium]MBX3034246.1 fumarylacetoacetate hydrolase family protein [Pseudobdellovibrionaceae bacterium]
MIHNVWAVGRNYADHAKELGNAVPGEPMIFLKAGSSVTTGPRVQWPAWAKDVHHELEWALEFGPELRFSRMALALDLTERTLQGKLKSQGHPWTLAKSFTGSCPLSDWVKLPASEEDQKKLRLQLFVNGESRQDGLVSQMIFPAEVLREFILARFPVRPGDVLLTGTPAGVGALHAGDQLEGRLSLAGKELLTVPWTVAG